MLQNVREQYEEFKLRPPPQRGYGAPSTGYGGERGYGDRAPERSNSYNNNRGRNNDDRGGYGGGGYNNSPAPPGSAMSPTTSSAPGADPNADYAAQYAQYYGNGAADPYAAYGGYAAYVQYYQQYMAATQAAQAAPGAAPGSTSGAPGSAPPPPPPSEAPPPPPPSGAPGYNAVSKHCLDLDLRLADLYRFLLHLECDSLCYMVNISGLFSHVLACSSGKGRNGEWRTQQDTFDTCRIVNLPNESQSYLQTHPPHLRSTIQF